MFLKLEVNEFIQKKDFINNRKISFWNVSKGSKVMAPLNYRNHKEFKTQPCIHNIYTANFLIQQYIIHKIKLYIFVTCKI